MSDQSCHTLISSFQKEMLKSFPQLQEVQVNLKDHGKSGVEAGVKIQLKGKTIFVKRHAYRMKEALRLVLHISRKSIREFQNKVAQEKTQRVGRKLISHLV